MTEDNQLQVLLKEQGLEKDNATAIIEAFGGPFDEAGKILATYQDIKVTDESQTDLMREARENRLALKKARNTVENNRKVLKEDIVKQGRAIDSIARFVKETIQPAEEYLEQQEKFAEIKVAERVAVVKTERIEELSKYSNDLSVYNLDTMTETAFQTLLAELKKAQEVRVAQEKAEREELARKEQERLAEEQRIREENEKLKAEAEVRESQLKKEREAEEIRLATERAEQEKKLAAEQAKFEEERKKREALEAERQAKEKAEAETKAASDEAERQALLAPDKDKLLTFSNALEVIRREKLPAVKTKQAQDVINLIDEMLTKMRNIIEQKAGEL